MRGAGSTPPWQEVDAVVRLQTEIVAQDAARRSAPSGDHGPTVVEKLPARWRVGDDASLPHTVARQ
jgi:putative N-acetylmannosamine-6-phosphate epimerase